MKPTMFALGIALLSTPVVAQAPPQAPKIRDVASGAGFTFVVKADGIVAGWGRNTDGQSAQAGAPHVGVGSPIVIDLPSRKLQVAMTDPTQHALLACQPCCPP